jgi:predicted small secreted protein
MNVQEFRRELGLLFGAIVLTGCSTTGGPDLSEMSFSDEPLVGKFVWYDLITDDATAIDAPGRVVWTELLACCLVLAGCSGNVGVGVSVGVPVGNHGYVSVGGTRWR